MPRTMNRPRVGQHEPKPRVLELTIVVACVAIALLLAWRVVGTALTRFIEPQQGQAVVLSDDDACLGGLCAQAQAQASR